MSIRCRRPARVSTQARQRMNRVDPAVRRALAEKRSVSEHNVHVDFIGINPKTRFTCHSEGCNEATLIEQPHFDPEAWRQARSKFLAKHPCSEIKDDGYRE